MEFIGMELIQFVQYDTKDRKLGIKESLKFPLKKKKN